MEYIIDANKESLGRTATKAAVILMGKNSPDFAKNKVASVKVKIVNASKVSIPEKKLKVKTYQSYSGYPGGLKRETMEKVINKKGYSEIFKKAVYGMLPANKLRAVRMKHLEVVE